ncbi:MAG: hypothetical protein WCJ62_00430 [Flavobacterium sp.]
MSERKNINKLFQENFENFEVIPDEIVWENIEKKLDEKKKRRVIPFWWKLSGIAAALLLGFFAVFQNTKPIVNNTNTVVNHDKEATKAKINATNPTSTTLTKELKSATVRIENKSGASTKEEITILNNPKIEGSVTNNKTSSTIINTDNISIAKSSNEGRTTSSDKQNVLMLGNNKSKSKIAYHVANHKKTRTVKTNISQDNNSSIAEKTIDNVEKAIESTNLNTSKESNSSLANHATLDQNKSVLNTSSKTDETINKKTDSIKIATVEPNALEELLKEKESKLITEPKLNRWQVSSNVAPIYFSSISKGSPLDDNLAANDKSYSANNQSYGVGVNYAVNKKLKIRTGINILNVDYSTNGISYYYQSEAVSGKLTNLNPNAAGSIIIIENLNNVNRPFNKIGDRVAGSLNQKLGYIEMPLELSYKILNKKFGIDLIGGMSTMVLNKNEIYLQSSDLNIKIGEASNLNNIHFSGNAGLGFKYNILKQLEARLEPVFKYQFNTFSNDSGNFKPYVFGVYSGINFSF